MNGRAHLSRLRGALCRGDRIPEDERRWLIAGFERWVSTSESLESALGIARDHKALATRDANLKHAVALMPFNWSKGKRVRQIESVARNLQTFASADAVNWSDRPAWHDPIMMAIQSAPIPGRRRLYEVCDIPESCTRFSAS